MRYHLAAILAAVVWLGYGAKQVNSDAWSRSKEEEASMASWDSWGSDAWIDFDAMDHEEIPVVVTEDDLVKANMKEELEAIEIEKEKAALRDLLEKAEKDPSVTINFNERKASFERRKASLEEATKNKECIAEGFESYSAWKESRESLIIEKEEAAEALLERIAQAENIDLAFIVDATGSMRTHIETVKDDIRKIISDLRLTHSRMNVRLAMVAYRDVFDDNRSEVLDFVHSVEEFQTFVSGIKAVGGATRGGYDWPEDMAIGIQKANGLSWLQTTRIVFVTGDYPCHGNEFNGGLEDNYPSGTPGIDIVRELKSLQRQGSATVDLYFGKITDDTNSMISTFARRGVDFKVFDVGDPKLIAGSVTRSVRRSIFRSSVSLIESTGGWLSDVETSLLGSEYSRKEYAIRNEIPSAREWESFPLISVRVFRNKKIGRIEDLRRPLLVGLMKTVRNSLPTAVLDRSSPQGENDATEVAMTLRKAAHPFNEGGSRIVFHAQLAEDPIDLNDKRKAMVVKSSKDARASANSRTSYFRQMEVSEIVHFLADLYNSSPARCPTCAKIRVLQVCVVEEIGEEGTEPNRYAAEAPLPTDGSEYTKFSNNAGYWNMDDLDESLLRFTAFTFQATKHFMMATDLQGVKRGNEIFLTDPALHCKDADRFDKTNLGAPGIRRCMDQTLAVMSEQGWSL